MLNFELLCCIVNSGHGSSVLKHAKQRGVKGGTICIAKGTVRNKFLEFLDIADMRKEFVIMICEKEIGKAALRQVSKEMSFHKPDHGIGFSFPLDNFIGTKHCEYYDRDENRQEEKAMFSAIFTVVEKGLAEDVVEAAKSAGARGGTIINARGSGINETTVIFAMPIEPEKEIILILAESDIVKPVTDAIRQQLHIDEAGRGVIFIVPTSATYGLYE